MKTASFLTLLLTLTFAGQQEPDDQTPRDANALKGRWEVVSSEFEGQDATAVYKQRTIIVIEDGELYFTDGFAASAKTRFKLDASTKPKSFDIGVGEEKVSKGIYSLDKDTLKLCLNLEGQRPKEFKTRAGDKNNFLTLKRQKP